jgi:phage tail sheath protein FI
MIYAVGKYTSTVINAVMGKAKERGNSIAIIDPSPFSTAATDFVSEAATYRAADGANYSLFCAPMLTMVDPSKTGPGAIRRTFPGGAVAGLYARTETERTVAKSPAGFTADIRNALGVDIKFSEVEIGTLYDNGINCFKAVPGGGIVLWGARTLERLRPDQYISVRRSLNYLKQALKDATQFAVFEPNDERLWTSVTAACGSVLNAFWSSGGLKGASASDAYYVVCDETNNTATTIDNGEVRVEVGVAVQYPAEFIVINLSQWTGGSNAVENL